MLLRVVFAPGDLAVEVEPGTTLLEASRRAGLDIPTGCTEGMCGTDAVRVAAGLEHLAPPLDHEVGTLERMGLPKDFRLACSARVVGGPVRVELDAF